MWRSLLIPRTMEIWSKALMGHARLSHTHILQQKYFSMFIIWGNFRCIKFWRHIYWLEIKRQAYLRRSISTKFYTLLRCKQVVYTEEVMDVLYMFVADCAVYLCNFIFYHSFLWGKWQIRPVKPILQTVPGWYLSRLCVLPFFYFLRVRWVFGWCVWWGWSLGKAGFLFCYFWGSFSYLFEQYACHGQLKVYDCSPDCDLRSTCDSIFI